METHLSAQLENFRKSASLSQRQLSEIADVSKSMVQNIENGEYDASLKGPGINAMHRMCLALGVALSDFFPTQTTANTRLGINDFFARHEGKNTPIKNYSDILHFCDVYDKPSGGKTHLVRVGPSSLLADRTKISDPKLLQIEYERWAAKKREAVYIRQLNAWKAGFISEPEFFDQRFDNVNKRVRLSILLAACRVRDFNGAQRLLIYCEPLSRKNN